MKQVMIRAWEIAKAGAKKFGGSVKSYFAVALKMAWAEAKEVVTIESVKQEIHNAYGQGYAHREVTVSFKEWKKDDENLHRLYINVENKGVLNTLWIVMKDGSVDFKGKNATFKAFGAKVATIIEKHKNFIITNFVA